MPPTKSINPVDVHVGSRVRELRAKHGMSQGKLAEQLGITFQQVQKYERGTNRVGARPASTTTTNEA
jgi:transcriptional regulator with XRE-family HTH domain